MITLKVRIDKSKHTIDCDESDNIMTVKAKIETKTGEQVKKRRLIFMGKSLSDSDKISELGIKNGSILMVTGCENEANAIEIPDPPKKTTGASTSEIHINPNTDVDIIPTNDEIDAELAEAIRMSTEATQQEDADIDSELAAAIELSNETAAQISEETKPTEDYKEDIDFERFNSDNVVIDTDTTEEINKYYSEFNRYVDPQFPPLPKSLYVDPKDAERWVCAKCSGQNLLPPVFQPPTTEAEATRIQAGLDNIRCKVCEVGKPTHVQMVNITNRPSEWLRPGTSCEGCEMIIQAQGIRDVVGVVSRNCTHYIRDDVTNNTVGMQWKVIRQEPRPEDVLQGSLGNCWFGGALGCIAQRTHLVEKLFITKEYNPVGAYVLQLHYAGSWKNMLIDDTFPCSKSWEGRIENNGNTIYFSRGGTLCYAKVRRHQLWVPLVEKASAKLFGSYGALKGGTLGEAMQLMTGYPCEPIPLQLPQHLKERAEKIKQYRTQLLLEGKNPDVELGDVEDYEEDTEEDIIWFKILSAKEAGFIIGVSCACDESEKTRYNEELGLQSPHAYGVLDVREVSYQGKTVRLLQIRNPWGENSVNTWKGNWGKTWPGWTRELKLELGVVNKGNVKMYDEMSIFWIEFSDLKKYFRMVDICRTHPPHWSRVSETGWLPSELGPGQAFEITVYKRTNVDLICWQEKHITRESDTSNIDVGFAVVQLSNVDGSTRCIEFVNPSIQDQCSVEVSLVGGYRYVIVPYSAAMLKAATLGKPLRRVTIVVYSDNHVAIRKIDQSWTDISTSLSRCIAARCKRKRLREDGVFSCTTKSAGGGHLTCVIENSSSSPAVVQVDTNCSNCYTSRFNNSGECVAFIPPKTEAVVMSLAISRQGSYSFQTALLPVESADFAEPATDLHQHVEFLTSSEMVAAVGEPSSEILSFPDANPELFLSAPALPVGEEERTEEELLQEAINMSMDNKVEEDEQLSEEEQLRLALEMSNVEDNIPSAGDTLKPQEDLTEEEEIALALKLSMANEQT